MKTVIETEDKEVQADKEADKNQKNKTKSYEKEFDLSDGTHCVMKRGKGIAIIRARKAAQDEELIYAHIIASTTTFDGKKRAAEDIVQLDVDDYILLEYCAKEFVAPKNL